MILSYRVNFDHYIHAVLHVVSLQSTLSCLTPLIHGLVFREIISLVCKQDVYDEVVWDKRNG